MSHDSAEHDGHECEEHETPWERVQSALALVRFDALHSVSYEYEALERLHKLVGGYVSPADARKPLTERTWQGWASTVLGVGWRTMLMRPRGQLTDPSERLTMVDWRTIPLQGYEAFVCKQDVATSGPTTHCPRRGACVAKSSICNFASGSQCAIARTTTKPKVCVPPIRKRANTVDDVFCRV